MMEKEKQEIDYEYLILKYISSYNHEYGKKQTLNLIESILIGNSMDQLPSYLQNVSPVMIQECLSKILVNAMQGPLKTNKGLDQVLSKVLKMGKSKEKIIKKDKNTKSSILDKISFLPKPIKKAFLIGTIAIATITSLGGTQRKDTKSLNVNSETTVVKDLEVNPDIMAKNSEYLLKKEESKVNQPIRITINKGIEKEHTEEEYQEKKKRVKYINYYARVYNLNEKKVKKIVKKNTKLLSYKSLNTKIDNKKLEFKILNTVKDINESIYAYQKSYGKMRESNYKKTKTYRQMVRHYAKLYRIDANKALAIELLESGRYRRPIATVKHNPGAKRRKDGEYYSYPNMEQGIIEHMITLCNYRGQSISEMAARYCSVKGAAGWTSEVQPFYNNLQKNPNAYYPLVDERVSQKKKTRKK